MKRILVVDDVSLWLSLNRYFAGGSDVEVSEVDSLETGMRLAQIERPDLLACGTQIDDRDRAWLEKSAAELPDRTRVLCVDKQADTGIPEPAPFASCRPERFLDTVGRWMDVEQQQLQGVSVDLLAHFEMPEPAGGEPRRGFANLIALSHEELLMESDDALDVGDQLSLTFFVGAEEGAVSRRQQVSLRCEIRRCHDAEKLLYVARARPVDEASEGALHRTIEQAQGSAETRP